MNVRYSPALEAINHIIFAAGGGTNPLISISTLLDQIARQLNVDAVAVLLRSSPAVLRFAAGRGFHTGDIQQLDVELADGYAGRAFLNHEIAGISDLGLYGDNSKRYDLLVAEEFKSYYVAPLFATNHDLGVLEVFHHLPMSPRLEWLEFVWFLAQNLAQALQSAQLPENGMPLPASQEIPYQGMIEGWVRALDMCDGETVNHTWRVTELTRQLAEAIGVPANELVHYTYGALLHDIGKLGVPNEMLNKPGPLTDAEWQIMHQHPEYAYQWLKPIPCLQPALDIPLYHHEKWDGSGYPGGLVRDEIPLAARIFAVVDVWDALQSDRPYRKAWSQSQALDYIKQQAGKHFDPQVVEAFLNFVLRNPSQG